MTFGPGRWPPIVYNIQMDKPKRATTGQLVADLLRKQILAGHLAPEQKLDEDRLSEELGVSRTPLREAFSALEREGLVLHWPYRGRFVAPRDAAMVVQLLPIIGALEAKAVALQHKWTGAQLDQLSDINRQIADPNRSAGERHQLDREWHELLISGCTNALLRDLIAHQRMLAGVHDGGEQRGMADVRRSTEEHQAIIEAIRRGDFAEAHDRTQEHWDNGVMTIALWRNQQGEGNE